MKIRHGCHSYSQEYLNKITFGCSQWGIKFLNKITFGCSQWGIKFLNKITFGCSQWGIKFLNKITFGGSQWGIKFNPIKLKGIIARLCRLLSQEQTSLMRNGALMSKTDHLKLLDAFKIHLKNRSVISFRNGHSSYF